MRTQKLLDLELFKTFTIVIPPLTQISYLLVPLVTRLLQILLHKPITLPSSSTNLFPKNHRHRYISSNFDSHLERRRANGQLEKTFIDRIEERGNSRDKIDRDRSWKPGWNVWADCARFTGFRCHQMFQDS